MFVCSCRESLPTQVLRDLSRLLCPDVPRSVRAMRLLLGLVWVTGAAGGSAAQCAEQLSGVTLPSTEHCCGPEQWLVRDTEHAEKFRSVASCLTLGLG